MTKKIWDLYAPIYERAMQMDEKIYSFMYNRIPKVIKDKEVLKLLPASSKTKDEECKAGNCVLCVVTRFFVRLKE